MKLRDSLNSKVLRARFPRVYEEFFSKCQLVVSSPHFFTWAGEYVGYFGGVMVLQKMPFRLYVGVEFLPDDSGKERIIVDDDTKSYSLVEKKFKKDQYEHLAQMRLLEFVNEFLKVSKIKEKIKIHLLSEIPFGGSGSSGALCSALAVVLSLLADGVTPESIEKWRNTKTIELLKNEELEFNSVFRLAWKMMAAYRGSETSGATVLTSLLSSKLPVFYILKAKKSLGLPFNIGDNYALIERVGFLAGRMNELFKLPQNTSFPFDFGLLYIGEPRGTVPYPTCQLRDDMIEASRFFDEKFNGGNFKKEGSQEDGIWQSNLEVMGFLSCQVLMKMGEVLKKGAREDALRLFLRAIDKHQALFLILGLLPKTVDSITSIVHHQARKIDELGAGLKSVSTTKQDIILFAFPHGRVREIFNNTLQSLEKELDIKLHLGYASWLDGIEEEGVKIEQYLDKEVYSDFISKETIRVVDMSKKQQLNLLLSPEDFAQKKAQIDLLLAEREGKIYIRGKALTSKELHSSKATVSLLKILLQNRGQEVSNRALPRSSYASDRYELQSKITSPLLKAIHKRTRKKLSLEVRGGVVDFSLKLEPGGVKIWLVK